MPVPEWFLDHLGWKKASDRAAKRCERLFGVPMGPNLADLSQEMSTAIAGTAYEALGIPKSRILGDLSGDANRSSGTQLEIALENDLRTSLQSLDPERDWKPTRSGGVEQFTQFEHLGEMQKLFEQHDDLAATIGQDYRVSTDVMIGVPASGGDAKEYALHAAVSSKLTIRSDRVQNIRFEFDTLVKNRRGRLPHLVVVTAEPLPSRLVAIARGTGQIDAVYHLMFDEIADALDVVADQRDETNDRGIRAQRKAWREIVTTKRLRPYHELAGVLASS